MALGQTVTAVSGVSSVAASSAINVPAGGVNDPVVHVASTSVTTGHTFQIEGLDQSQAPLGTADSTWRPLGDPVAVTANGNLAVPLDAISPRKRPAQIRINVTARTDGTATLSLVETPKRG